MVSSQPSPGASEAWQVPHGLHNVPPVPLPYSGPFYALLGRDSAALLPAGDPPPPTPPPSISAGTREGGRGGNVLVGTEAAHFSCLDTAVRGAASGTRQTSTASHAAPRAPLAASRQNASEVCTAVPALNNVRLCRRSPRSHPSATRINHVSLGAG